MSFRSLRLASLISLTALMMSPHHAHAQTTVQIPPILEAGAMKQVDPCDDFYQFACGGFIDNTQIPNDKTSVNRQITPLSDAVDITLNKVLVQYSHGDTTVPASASKKLGDVYQACLDMDAESKAATKLVEQGLTAIQKVSSRKAFSGLIAMLHLKGTSALFGFGPSADPRDSNRVIGDAGQGGIAFGERDYYLKTDAKSVEIRAKYVEHIEKMFLMYGATAAEAKASSAAVMKIETELALNSYALDDLYDPNKTTHLINRAGLVALAPHFDWASYFDALQVTDEEMNVDEPEFFQALDKLLVKTSKTDMDRYLSWEWIHATESSAGGAFTQASFDFWSAYLNGTKAQLPPWKKCTEIVENSALGYGLAEAYVHLFDGNAIKVYTEGMIEHIKDAFAANLDVLTHGPDAWMDEVTLTPALEKVKLMAQKVGAPDHFRDYTGLQTVATNHLANVISLSTFNAKRQLNKIGLATDKTEWDMMPWEVNAYYDPTVNGFVFPFGTLQPPALDVNANDGANYGSFGGGTIGHELSHGFDSSGRKYDAHGNVNDWWSPKTAAQFETRKQCYIDQANAYTIKDVGLKVAGERVITENLADQGGVKMGYVALEKILATRPQAAPWNGFTERQQYWIAYGQSWCTKMTPESLRARMTTDPHPPAEFRVNGVVMNRPEFAKDFSCKAGAPMAPIQRCSLW